MSSRALAWIAGVIVLVAGAAVAIGLLGEDDISCSQPPGVTAPGRCIVAVEDRPAAPSTSLPVLGDLSTQLSVQEFTGDVVVVNFWGSWCVPCRLEQPEFNRVHATYRDQGVSFLGVDVAESSQTNGLAHEEEFSIPYPSLWDPPLDYAADFEVIGPQVLPATVIVDRQGRVAASIFGPTTEVELSAFLDKLLAESAGT